MGGEDVKNIENSEYKTRWRVVETIDQINAAAVNSNYRNPSSCYLPQPWELHQLRLIGDTVP